MNDRSPATIFVRLTFFFSFFIFFTLNLVASHGIVDGIHLALLGWSAYVLCLPFLGGGVLLYPFLRFITNLSSYGWEVAAWLGAIIVNIATLCLRPHAYELTPVTHFLLWAFEHPFPYWGIFILSLMPLIAAGIYNARWWPYQRWMYYQLRLILTALSLIFLWYVALHDMIILSNIHA